MHDSGQPSSPEQARECRPVGDVAAQILHCHPGRPGHCSLPLRSGLRDTNTCGFSGGAKVASYIALHDNNVKGVIAGGAGLPDETQAGNFNFSFTDKILNHFKAWIIRK